MKERKTSHKIHGKKTYGEIPVKPTCILVSTLSTLYRCGPLLLALHLGITVVLRPYTSRRFVYANIKELALSWCNL